MNGGPTILVVLDTPARTAACLRAAADAAPALPSARIEALCIRMDPAGTLLVPEVMTPRYEHAIEQRSATESAALRAAFDAWQASSPSASPMTEAIWIEVDAVPAEAIRERGALAALLVLARPSATTHPSSHAGFDAALFETGKPVLVIPPGDPASPGRPGAPFGRHLAVGWRDAPATRRSLAALRPWLFAATTVSLIAVTEGDATLPPDWAAEHLPPSATLRTIRPAGRSDAEALLQEAAALGADGLAIGAFWHGRLMERLLGGVTADVLAAATLPLLMQV